MRITQKVLKHYEYLNSYVNPIVKAKEYQEVLEKEGIGQAELANRLGVSRVRVSQMLNLLKLPKDRQDYVLKHGRDELITERMLRKAISG